MPRNITITFNDNSKHRYENIPDYVTPDDIEKRVNKDFPGKKITNIDGGKKSTQSSELDQVKKNAGVQSSRRSSDNYENSDWEIFCKSDKLTDDKVCTIMLKQNRKVQCNPKPDGRGTLYVGTPYRQRPDFIYYRFDNESVVNRLPDPIEKELLSVMFPESALRGKSRLRVKIISLLKDEYDFDINLSTLQDAISEYIKQGLK